MSNLLGVCIIDQLDFIKLHLPDYAFLTTCLEQYLWWLR